MKEYKIAKGWLVFIYGFAFVLYGVSGWLMVFPFLQHSSHYLWAMPVAILVVVFATACLRNAIISRLIIAPDSATLITLTGTRKMLLTDVAGYRHGQRGLMFLEPQINTHEKMKIHAWYGQHNELLKWVRASFSDLDKLDEAMKYSLMEGDGNGKTVEERLEKKKNAKNVAWIVNFLSIPVGIWGCVYPHPYLLAVACSAIYPFLCILLLIPFNGLIKLVFWNEGDYSSVTFGFCFSCIALIFRTLIDFQIFSHRIYLWLYAVPFIIFVLLLMLWARRFRKTDPAAIQSRLVLLIFVIAYCYNMVAFVNCYFDESLPIVYKPVVAEIRRTRDKRHHGRIFLTPWAGQKEAEVVDGVGLSDTLEVGDTVNVCYFTGWLKVPWFAIKQ